MDAAVDAAPALLTPKVHWEFEGTTNNTGSTSGYALATPAGVSYAPGKIGMAISFGSGQYSNVGQMRNLLGTAAAVTIAFWLKEPGTLNSAGIVDIINRNASPYGGIQLGLSGNTGVLCVATTSSSLLGGGCGGPTSPSANTWHHWILRYQGTSTSSGGGGPTEIYVDDALVYTQANDASNNPVFSATGIPDTLTIGNAGVYIDDMKIFTSTYDRQTQCTGIIGGTWTGSACTLP